MPQHVLVIYNPVARSQVQNEQWMGQVIDALNKHGDYLVSFYPTTSETGPEHLVPLFKPPLDFVIAAGGDGTIRFALVALAKAHSDIPCAILPLGTGNVLARNLGIVEDSLFANPLEHAFEYITSATPVRIDMAMMNGELFAGMAGVGPLSDAFMAPGRAAKTKFKLLAYVDAMLKTITMPPHVFKITSGGTSFKVQASGVFVANVEDLGIGKPNDLNILQDGFLDLHVVNPQDFKDYLSLGFRFAAGNVDDSVPEYILKVKEVMVEAIPRHGVRSAFQQFCTKIRNFFAGKAMRDPPRSNELPVMIDGEEAGVTPMRVTILPQAVCVLVPKDNPGLAARTDGIQAEEKGSNQLDVA